ncbi:MAG: hypothetical protein K8R69_07105, partial [Deltaproteobacteria bacterium]|nr:hypothetical protein [Deltaproteobacteria bacterium]
FGVLERPFLNAKQAATLEALEKSEENINGFKSFPKVNSDAFLRLFSSEWKLSFVKGLSRVLLEARQGQDQALAPYRATFDLYPAMTGYLTLPQNAKPNPQGMTAVFRLTVRPLRDVDPKFRASELEYDVLSGGLPEEVKDLLELLRGYSWSDGEEWLGD